MQRIGFLLKVRKDMIDEYKARHKEVWPEMKEALRRHLDDPHTLVVHGPYFQAWGRKPA